MYMGKNKKLVVFACYSLGAIIVLMTLAYFILCHTLICIDGKTISANPLSSDCKLQIEIEGELNNYIVLSKNIKSKSKVNIEKVLRKYIEKREESKDYKVAYIALKNDGNIKITARMGILLRSFNYQINTEEPQYPQASIKGKCAKLKPITNDISQLKNIRMWLFRKKIRLDEEMIYEMAKFHGRMKMCNYTYQVKNKVYSFGTFLSGYEYKVDCDVKSDFYGLVAAANASDISHYVEDVIGSNFKNMKTDLMEPLYCEIDFDRKVYRIITLVCLNEDWSYKIVPLGVLYEKFNEYDYYWRRSVEYYCDDEDIPNSVFLSKDIQVRLK